MLSSNNRALIAEGIAVGVTYVISPAARKSKPGKETIPMQEINHVASGIRPDSVLASGNAHEVYSNIQKNIVVPFEVAALEESFEDPVFPPPGWNLQTAGAPIPYTWHRTTDTLYVKSGLGAALVQGNYSGTIDEWLITPALTISANDRAVKFQWAGSRYWAGGVDAQCCIRTVGSTECAELWALSSEPQADPFIYRDRTIDISQWIGETVQLAFRVTGTNGAGFALDDIEVGDFEPTSVPENDICSNAIALSGHFDITGVTCYAGDEMSPCIPPDISCPEGDLGGSDLWYNLNVTAGDTLIASASGEWNPALYLMDGCSDPSCLAWAYAVDGLSPSSIGYVFAAGGTYYLVVDGAEGSCGPFSLAGEITGTGTGIPGGPSPSTYLLHQPYPNPFNPYTTIPFYLPRTASVSLRIYDVSGRLVRMLMNDIVKEAGKHTVIWDGTDDSGKPMASSVYFCRFEAGSHRETRRAVLIK